VAADLELADLFYFLRHHTVARLFASDPGDPFSLSKKENWVARMKRAMTDFILRDRVARE
jgi:hypothetical protein